MCVCVCVCVCLYIFVFVSLCMRVYSLCFIQCEFEVFSFTWSSVSSLVWYMDILLNNPLLHSYWFLDIFNFLFSGILMLLLWSDILRASVEPMYTSLHLLHSIMSTSFFELQFKSIYHEFCLGVFEDIGFLFFNSITSSTSFILVFSLSLCCIFPGCRRGEYFLKDFEVVSRF